MKFETKKVLRNEISDLEIENKKLAKKIKIDDFLSSPHQLVSTKSVFFIKTKNNQEVWHKIIVVDKHNDGTWSYKCLSIKDRNILPIKIETKLIDPYFFLSPGVGCFEGDPGLYKVETAFVEDQPVRKLKKITRSLNSCFKDKTKTTKDEKIINVLNNYITNKVENRERINMTNLVKIQQLVTELDKDLNKNLHKTSNPKKIKKGFMCDNESLRQMLWY